MSLAQKLDSLRTFFGLPISLAPVHALPAMQELMGMAAIGPLPAQVEALIAATGIGAAAPAPDVAPASAATPALAAARCKGRATPSPISQPTMDEFEDEQSYHGTGTAADAGTGIESEEELVDEDGLPYAESHGVDTGSSTSAILGSSTSAAQPEVQQSPRTRSSPTTRRMADAEAEAVRADHRQQQREMADGIISNHVCVEHAHAAPSRPRQEGAAHVPIVDIISSPHMTHPPPRVG